MKNCIKSMKKRIKLKKTRTTVSLSQDAIDKAANRITERRAANFSNYVEILIAEDAGINGKAVPA